MITIFACPKPFVDPHIALIQRNAIRSWLALGSDVQVILFGDEEGIHQAASDFSCQHVPFVLRNEFGTPFLNDVFEKAETLARYGHLCYANADIILMDDFLTAIAIAAAPGKRCLIGGRVWNAAIREELSFSSDWQDRLRSIVESAGVLRPINSCDYFVFTKGLWTDLPPYIVGRPCFDNALLFGARNSGARLVDATNAVKAIHQNHSYTPVRADSNVLTSDLASPEALRNIELAGGLSRLYNWGQATHVIRGGKLRRSWSGTAARYRIIWEWRIWFPFLRFTRPVRHLMGLKRGQPQQL